VTLCENGGGLADISKIPGYFRIKGVNPDTTFTPKSKKKEKSTFLMFF
jgi:hypothetical protein